MSRDRSNVMPLRTIILVLAALLLAVPHAHAGPTAQVTGRYTDGCRDFTAISSKDISHVVLQYADGRVVKDETINAHDWSIDGSAGDELGAVVVKSGTTREIFTCDRGGAPEAVLEIRLSPYCEPYTSGQGDTFYWCRDGLPNTERTVYVDPAGLRIDMGCLPADAHCQTISVRGAGSTDPDGDLATWSISFGDGTTHAGTWNGSPPVEVTHEFAAGTCAAGYCHVTLTVTDAQGLSDSASLDIAFFDLTPD